MNCAAMRRRSSLREGEIMIGSLSRTMGGLAIVLEGVEKRTIRFSNEIA